ncbi:MAG: hypothetical protein CSA20_00895 [Deltaproteobacteria bacterium]|nr:MAG: hypothetical protein CSA20_00895 [Deltaproteobacteria bacterium]
MPYIPVLHVAAHMSGKNPAATIHAKTSKAVYAFFDERPAKENKPMKKNFYLFGLTEKTTNMLHDNMLLYHAFCVAVKESVMNAVFLQLLFHEAVPLFQRRQKIYFYCNDSPGV